MMKNKTTATLAAIAMCCAAATAQAAGSAQAVTADNFIRAESDRYFGMVVRQGGLGKFRHYRELMAIDRQTVIRPNRDTLYSSAVFDLDAGSVRITLPDPGKRYMSMQVIDEDHQVQGFYYGAGEHRLSRDQFATRYVIVGVRTLVNPADPADVAGAHALQDAIHVEQPGSGSFDVPSWDAASLARARDALAVLGATVPDSRGMYGTRSQVSPVRHLIGTATAWGGNPEKDTLYMTVTPPRNDGTTVHKLSVKDVPVDAFWSISVYNAKGYFEQNAEGAYTLNNLGAKKGADGSVTVQFGGCVNGIANCLPVMPGWNYMVRLYRPRAEILDGSWNFPAAQPER